MVIGDKAVPFRAARWALLLAACAVVAAGAAGGPAGHWQGEIAVPGTLLAVRIHLALAGTTWSGTIDIPAQGATGLALSSVAVTGDSIAFGIAGVPGTPTFRGVCRGDSIAGTFTQRGFAFPFHLARGSAEAMRRPQDPVPPFPYRAEEVTFTDGKVTLAGTLTVPQGDGPFPAVVLVTGSGPQNRNEEVFDHRPFLVIADHLSRHGIAVLRYDDRGVGASGGDAATSTTDDVASDALAGVDFLRGRAGIAADHVGILGHSEGALAAAIAASRSDHVAFVIMLAGPGVPMTQLLPRQAEALMVAEGVADSVATRRAALVGQALAVVAAGGDEAQMLEKLHAIVRRQFEATPESARPHGADLDAIIDRKSRQLLTPWFRWIISYDPATALRKVRVPVLALDGALDRQVVASQNLPAIEKALAEAGNDDVTARELPGLNHLFQHATTGAIEEYHTIDETISPDVLDMITEWIRKRFAR